MSYVPTNSGRPDSDAIATIDLAAVTQPPLPEPPTEPQTRRWLGAVVRVLLLGGCFALAVGMQWRGLSWTASAAAWLDGAARKGGAAEIGAVGVLWREASTLGLTLGQVVSVWQLCVAAALLAMLLRVAWQVRGRVAAVVTLLLFLLWPTSRALLHTVGAEAPLATLLLSAVLAGLLALRRPLAGTLLLGASLALLVLVHPLGLPLALVVLLAVLVLPVRDSDEPPAGLTPGMGLWPQALTLTHGVAMLLGVALTAAVYGPGGFKIAWLRQMADWRAPTVTPWLGGATSWPVVGALVAFAGQIPLPLLVLAGATTVRAARRPADPVALPAAIGAGSWLALTWLGLPTPDFVDAVALLAPGMVLLAAVVIVDVAGELLALGTVRARAGALVLAVTTLLALLCDLHLAEPDRRNLLAHIPGVMSDPVGAQPAVLTPADIGLLYAKPVATTILPSHVGGNPLALAMRTLHPPLAGLNFGAAFSTDQVLVATTRGVSVESLWRQIGKLEACTADERVCLVRIRVK